MKIKGLTLLDSRSSFWVKPLHQDLVADSRKYVCRTITPEAGRGLEKLGHAIDYLTDEFVHDGCRFEEDRGRLQAIALLASLNRQIYLACAVVPTFRERVYALVDRLFSPPNL